jgi:hypothetical protein
MTRRRKTQDHRQAAHISTAEPKEGARPRVRRVAVIRASRAGFRLGGAPAEFAPRPQ